jgi:hypothetical protein
VVLRKRNAAKPDPAPFPILLSPKLTRFDRQFAESFAADLHPA